MYQKENVYESKESNFKPILSLMVKYTRLILLCDNDNDQVWDFLANFLSTTPKTKTCTHQGLASYCSLDHIDLNF